MRIAIDTNILMMAYGMQESRHQEVAIWACRNGNQVCHDHAGVIEKEYRKRLGDLEGFRKWYRRLQQVNAIDYCRGDLNPSYVNKLCKLGCHEPTDHVFIAVAYHTDRILVSEDSDVGKGPKGNQSPHCDALSFLSHELNIMVLGANEFCASY